MAVRDPGIEWLRVQIYRRTMALPARASATPGERMEIAARMFENAVPLVGSFASTFWGRPRSTHDANLVVESRGNLSG
jgi:hypothetical protein